MYDERMKPRPPKKAPLDPNVLYRVRDREWAKLWGENLSLTDATKLKEQVVTSKKSNTARLEPMSIPPPAWYVADNAGQVSDLSVAVAEEAPPLPRQQRLPAFGVSGFDPVEAPHHGEVTSIPDGCQLYVNDVMVQVPAEVSGGDTIHARPLDPALAEARAAALAAARPVAQAKNDGRPPYRDRSVKIPAPRTTPPPADKTVSKTPVFIRLDTPVTGAAEPLPSPQKVAEMRDGNVMPDGALSDDDLPEIAYDLGGTETQDDIDHANRERDRR